MDKQLSKLVRKMNNVREHGGQLTFSSVTRQLHDSGHTVKQVQQIILILFKEYKSRRQIARVIRAHTGQSTINLK